jgi:inorganic triphosphatase YgiF
MEIEAKYRATKPIEAADIEALDFSPYTLGPRVEHDLRDSLLDTPERELARRRYALRVRQDGAEIVLTLKAPAETEGGIHRREEWEEPLPGSTLYGPATWPESIRFRLRDLIGEKPLQEILRVRNHRRTWDVLREGRRVGELALDKGTIEADDAWLPLHEIEFELKGGGQQEDMDHVTRLLTANLPLEPEPQSKQQRGLALLEAQQPQRLESDLP